MTARLTDLADGLGTILDDRLAPEGQSVEMHYVSVARHLHDAEVALARLDHEPGPFETDDRLTRANDAGYALLEAARSMMGLAVRLRARLSGQHARRASEPLRAGLVALSADPPHGDAEILLMRAAHALVIASPAVQLAANSDAARAVGASADSPIEHMVASGVLSLLQLTLMVQEGELP